MTEWAAGDAAGVVERGPLEGVPEAEVVTVAPPGGRPTGPRFGTLVHAALATVPLDVSPAVLEALVATHGRIVGADGEEVAAAVSVVGRGAAASARGGGARVAERDGRCHRELPLTMLDGDLLLEGVADLAFEHDGVMTVVDFKTDRPDPETLDRYARQVRSYAAAIQRATGKAVRPVCCRCRRRVVGAAFRPALQLRDPLVQIADGRFEHGAMGRRAGLLQIGQRARPRRAAAWRVRRGAPLRPDRPRRREDWPCGRPAAAPRRSCSPSREP